MIAFRAQSFAALAAASLVLLVGCGGSDHGSEAGANGASGVFLSILPPGENGNAAGGIGSPVPGSPVLSYPADFRDQLDLYGNLAYAKRGLKADPCTPPSDIGHHQKFSDLACNYFKSEGLTPDTVVSTITLTAANGKKVKIERDGWGVPFVTGDDRESAEYGVGYASAQDRLWLYDLLRHVGRGRVSEYLGPASATYDLDDQFGSAGGYDENEMSAMVEVARAKLGPIADLAIADLASFVAGMNAYVAFLATPQGLLQIPPEYASLKPLGFPPRAFTVNDIVASATLILAQFGGGGGGEVTNELLLQHLDASFGPGATEISRTACEVWRDLRHANDPDSPTTIETSFATQSPASLTESCPQSLPAGVAIWDPGSFSGRSLLTHAGIHALPPLPAAAPAIPFTLPLLDLQNLASRASPAANAALASLASIRLGFPHALSNWIGVNADQTKRGHPIVVMGPQTSYFVPQLLSEIAVKSNGGTELDFAGRGIITVNLPYIVIGRGSHYTWSATSGESDLIDTRVSKLCNMDGTPASRDDANGDGFPDADGYLFDAGDGKGMQCRRFYKRVDTWTATPTPASIALGGPPLPETVTRHILRTHYGHVFATATVNGEPVAISRQRSSFFDELGTTAPFVLLTSQIPMDHPTFKKLFNSMTASFNWMYADEKDLGYFHSGLYPQRHPEQQAELPVWGDGRFEWVVDQGKLDANFFATYGGDGNNGAKSFPNRSVAVAQGDPMQGYFEWPGFLSLAAHPQATNPAKGYMMSWNNRPAKDWWAADSNGTFGPIHRVDMLRRRLAAFQASGKKHDIASMIEIMADAAYTDLRGQEVLPLLLQIMQAGVLTADQQRIVTLMQDWIDETSSEAWIGPTAKGLGPMRRDRDGDGVYDFRPQVVLMDAWYPRLIDGTLPQLTAISSAGFSVLQARYDAPRAQGSAFQEGWFEHMKRVLEMVLDTPGHTSYRQLQCAGGTLNGCRAAVLTALDLALGDLGGLSNMSNWTGAPGRMGDCPGGGLLSSSSACTVEQYDSVRHTSFSFLPVPAIHWVNRPTFQQAVQVESR
jgi:acyl-homoserine lactone acylase PvdQ